MRLRCFFKAFNSQGLHNTIDETWQQEWSNTFAFSLRPKKSRGKHAQKKKVQGTFPFNMKVEIHSLPLQTMWKGSWSSEPILFSDCDFVRFLTLSRAHNMNPCLFSMCLGERHYKDTVAKDCVHLGSIHDFRQQ